jgi:hypothetical protein
MDLGERKSPSSAPTSEKLLLNVEGLNDARTPLADFFSILLEPVRRVRDGVIHVEGSHRLTVADVAADP